MISSKVYLKTVFQNEEDEEKNDEEKRNYAKVS